MNWKTILGLRKKREPRRADEFEKLPEHVAIIMDGNGRWAKKHRLSVSLGHRQGTETLREIIRHTDDLGIKSLSLYAFSTENWNRSAEEVAALMQLILDFFASEIDELDAKNVRILILGDKGRLPEVQRETLMEAERRTRDNTGLRLNIAINYGGRAELVKAVQEISVLVKNGTIRPEAVTEQMISDHLYTAGQKDVDLLIRTSGEMRLSNFLLYQNAYAEFLFPETLWPDFTVQEYDRALAAFGKRDRRYGGREDAGARKQPDGAPPEKRSDAERQPTAGENDRPVNPEPEDAGRLSETAGAQPAEQPAPVRPRRRRASRAEP